MARHVIALVEDDTHIMRLFNDLLGEEGYSTLAIPDGASAHAIIAREQPDLIILDLWLVRQDAGWTIYNRLRTNDTTAHIPIIICSADIAQLRERAPEIEARSDGAVEKPFDIAILLALIADLLRRAPAARQAV